MKEDFKKRLKAMERAKKMEIKTYFDIDMGKGNWNFPCCAGIKKYVDREQSDMNFKNLDIFFDDTDEALSVSTELFSGIFLA